MNKHIRIVLNVLSRADMRLVNDTNEQIDERPTNQPIEHTNERMIGLVLSHSLAFLLK